MTRTRHQHIANQCNSWERLVVPFLALIVAAGSAFSAPVLAQDSANMVGKNLLRSASFDVDQLTAGVPTGWTRSTWGGEPVFRYVRNAGKAKPGCFRISSESGANASWSQRVTVKPNRKYRLSGWVKTEQVDKGGGFGVVINVHELGHGGKSKGLDGDHDWTELSVEFESGNRTEFLINMTFGGWGNATGTAWFDDLKLAQVMDDIDMPVETMTEPEAIAFYQKEVLPILKKRCYECHADDPEDLQGSFAVTSHASIMRGGDSGAAIEPDDLRESIFLRAINYDIWEMPPSGKMPADEIKTLTKWVKLGLPFDPDEERDLTANAAENSHEPEVNEETRKWWSFQPVRRAAPPEVNNTEWVQNPIDRFVLSRLERAGLEPAPRASRQTLIRRAYYDLIGLPPTPEQVSQFVADQDPNAYQKLVDQLLSSRHYGEKWGRHWLDLVRYAESNSFERDGTKPFVWRYRDYVIRAFNNDKPYDQFIREQLAGDELPEPTNESMIATGYYRLGAWDDEPADPLLAKYDDLDDIVATTSQTFMGLTVNCARCHNHKIDPIPQADYYRMTAFFENIRRYGVRSDESVFAASVKTLAGDATPEQQADYQSKMQQIDAKIKVIVDVAKAGFESVEHEDFQYEMNQEAILQKRVGKEITRKQFNQFKQLKRQRQELLKSPPGSIKVLCVKEEGNQPPQSFVRIRGNPHVTGDPVEPGFISVLSPPDPEIKAYQQQSLGRRLALANWLTGPEHPLTSRVMVNRIWQFHFGRGIVRTASDFGFQGSQPTHPELLDWLAAEFIRQGWSIKQMHRLIMTSAAYQMDSRFNQDAYDQDPTNDLFWRFNLRRLTAEEIRDSILAVSGQLNRDKMFGPSIFPTMPPEVLAGQSRPGKGWGNSSEEDKRRRSIYVHVKRSLALPILSTHDSADTDTTCPVRFITTQPTQALGMINSRFTNEQARLFAEQVKQLGLDTVDQQVREVLRRVMQRPPNDEETERALTLVRQWQSQDGVTPQQAFEYFCLFALNLNEFVYVD